MLTQSEVADVAGLGSQPQVVISASGQPKDLAVGDKDTPSFSVFATVVNGDPAKLTYQWQRDSVNIPSATASTYTLAISAVDHQKKFRCVVSYPGIPSVTSAEAVLTVLPEIGLIFSFDAAPVGDVVADSSPNAVKHDGSNLGATWVATEDGRDGVMSFDGDGPSQITIAAAADLNSMRGTVAFWMKSARTTPTPNPYAMLFDRRAMPGDGVPVTGGEVLFQLPDGHVSNQAEIGGRTRANEFSTAANLTDNNLDDFRIYNRVLNESEIAALAGALPPQLSISRTGVQVILTWDTGTLWSSSTVDGIYTELSAATSPYAVQPAPGQQQLFHVRR
jgi:hypothetical protein